jgi:hypothetical protein
LEPLHAALSSFFFEVAKGAMFARCGKRVENFSPLFVPKEKSETPSFFGSMPDRLSFLGYLEVLSR